MGFPGRKTFQYSKEDLKKCNNIIRKLNGIAPIYKTINDFKNSPISENTIIKRIMFDFDVDDKARGKELEDARKLHEYLKKKNISHTIFFSGRGFHIFVKTIKTYAKDLLNPREAVRNAHTQIAKEADVSPDRKTVDLVRIARLPNTINTKSRLFCIPLLPEQLYLPKQEIERMAQKQRLIDYTPKGELIDLNEYDGPLIEPLNYEQSESVAISDEILQKELPSCIIKMLSDGDCGFFERYSIITVLRDLCYSEEDVRKILKKYLTPKKYRHCIYEEGQLNYLFSRQDLLFPSCTRLKSEGFCIDGCRGQNVYFEV